MKALTQEWVNKATPFSFTARSRRPDSYWGLRYVSLAPVEMRSPHALRQRVSESWLHATAFVAISLWGLLWIGAAIWPYHRGLWGYGWGS
jgi:hypothetical protein